MADKQAKITDFFLNGKRGGRCDGRLKRKAISPVREVTTVGKRKCLAEEASPSKSVSITSRGKLLVSLSQSPVKSPRKTELCPGSPVRRKLSLAEALNSPVKDYPEPAYLKFKHLASKESDTNLALPVKYKVIAESFRCLDTVISMMHNRKESCTFDKVKKAVQEMTRSTFDMRRLAQIKSVAPDLYTLNYEKQSKISKDLVSKLEFTLVVAANLETKLMSPAVLLQRKKMFMKALVDRVKDHHQQFLMTLEPPISVDKRNVVRWHPKFRLEEVLDIIPIVGVIPKPPVRANTQMESFILGLAESKTEPQVHVSKSIDSPSVKISSGALKGLSSGLLDKIRMKEAQNIAKDLTRSPELEKKITMIKRLPDFIRIIHNYYVGEKKTTLPLENVVIKTRDSYYTFTSAPEVQSFIELLAEVLPDWLYILKVKKGSFVKIDKNKTIESLIKRLDLAVEKLKCGCQIKLAEFN
ncbi:DNA replication factor Cdt1 [Halotydeus destructor]|nr:DNA replication factor Cdt1 [Halotydeus destructor]